MKKERLQQIMWKYKRVLETIMNNYMAINIDNPEEMDRFLEKFSLPRLNQEEKEIMNNLITSTKIETVIKYLPKKQRSGTRWLYRRILSNFRKELMPILLKVF